MYSGEKHEIGIVCGQCGWFNALGLSTRAHDRILRVSRTLADLDGEDQVAGRHLAEAIHYRCLDRPARPYWFP